MEITLKELKAMIKESVQKALKEQGDVAAAALPARAPSSTPATPAPVATPAPAPRDQRQATSQSAKANVTNAINSIIRRLNTIVREALSATPAGGQPSVFGANVIVTQIAQLDSMLSRLARNQDLIMLGKQDKINQAVNLLKRVARTPIDSGANAQRLVRNIYSAVRLLREVTRELGSQDSQTDQMIAQLATASSAPTSPEVGGMRQGMAPQPLAGSQVVPVGYRPEGGTPQERPVMASAMQEKRTKKR